MKLHLQVLLIFLAITSFAFGQYSATIKVTDVNTGLNLENAEVIFDNNFFGTTDANGESTFTNIANGTYNYTVSLGCYEILSSSLTINNSNLIENAELTPSTTNSVFFFVGSPLTISGATVILSDGGSFYQEIVTGAPFGDIIENVPFGEYSYTIITPCYETVTGNVTVNCTDGNGMVVEANPNPSTTNSVFFFVGSPLTISGATVILSDGGSFYQEIVTGAPFGDIIENVPFGEYSYTITAPCYETVTGNVTVNCTDGNGMVVEANPNPSTTNSVFFFVGSPLTISGATIILSDGGSFYQEIVTGAPFGDIIENVPFGEYSYTITAPCYETVTGNVTVNCTDGNGMVVEANPNPCTTNSVFFFVGSPLTISGATIILSDGGSFYQEIVTGAPFGDIIENVPFGEYSYTITAPCYESVTGNVTVNCTDGNGMVVEANPNPSTTNSVFFFVGSPLTISGATVILSDGGSFYQEIVTGAPFGDIIENVPFGEYSYTITAPCYETVTGNVTVNCTDGNGMVVEANPAEITIDNSTTQDANLLAAVASGYDYQWIDCSTDEPIEGETSQTFTASENGNYAVIISSENCTTTSECMQVTTVGISQYTASLEVSTYPNPFTEFITFESEEFISNDALVQVFSTTGQLVKSQSFYKQRKIQLNLSDLQNGCYLVQIISGNAQYSQQVIKQ